MYRYAKLNIEHETFDYLVYDDVGAGFTPAG